MLWIYLFVLFILLFGGLLYFLQYVLTKRIRKETERLHELSKAYATKEEEANKLLNNAQKEAKGIIARETQTAEETKRELINNAEERSEQVLKEAAQKGLQITEKAQHNADFLRNEIDQRIDERAKEKVNDLIQTVIPRDFLEEVHQCSMEKAKAADFNLHHLKLPQDIDAVKIVSAFPLTTSQQTGLKKRLKEKTGIDTFSKIEVDPSLITGFIITIGSVVIDASLKYKIQVAMQK